MLFDAYCRFTIPQETFIFKEVYHYRIIYNEMISWWDKFSIKLINYYNLLFALKEFPKVYEYYCLLRLLKVFEKMHYTYNLKELLDGLNKNDDYSGKIVLVSQFSSLRITIFYEAKIYYNHKKKTEHDLLRIKPPSRIHPWNYFWPDYLIKYEFLQDNKTFYGIFDAKFSTLSTLRKEHTIEKISYKYLHLISNIKRKVIPISYVWILYPADKETIECDQIPSNNDITPYPSIGLFTLSPAVDDQSFMNLINRLEEIIITMEIEEA